VKTADRQAEGTGGETEETSGCVRSELLNRWPNCMLASWW